jgi:hypothetical protein
MACAALTANLLHKSIVIDTNRLSGPATSDNGRSVG